MDRKYSVILGNLGNTCDRFCSGYKDNPSTMEMLKRAAAIPHVQGNRTGRAPGTSGRRTCGR